MLRCSHSSWSLPLFGDFSSAQDNLDNTPSLISFSSCTTVNKTSLIFAFSYAAWSPSTFITWNAFQSGQLWTKVWFSACNPNNQVPTITIVTINLHMQIIRWRDHARPSAQCPQIRWNINFLSCFIFSHTRNSHSTLSLACSEDRSFDHSWPNSFFLRLEIFFLKNGELFHFLRGKKLELRKRTVNYYHFWERAVNC